MDHNNLLTSSLNELRDTVLDELHQYTTSKYGLRHGGIRMGHLLLYLQSFTVSLPETKTVKVCRFFESQLNLGTDELLR